MYSVYYFAAASRELAPVATCLLERGLAYSLLMRDLPMVWMKQFCSAIALQLISVDEDSWPGTVHAVLSESFEEGLRLFRHKAQALLQKTVMDFLVSSVLTEMEETVIQGLQLDITLKQKHLPIELASAIDVEVY